MISVCCSSGRSLKWWLKLPNEWKHDLWTIYEKKYVTLSFFSKNWKFDSFKWNDQLVSFSLFKSNQIKSSQVNQLFSRKKKSRVLLVGWLAIVRTTIIPKKIDWNVFNEEYFFLTISTMWTITMNKKKSTKTYQVVK